jgi:DNA-binding SARP family transcriptional activator
MSALVLKFLGTPEISYQDQSLKFATRKVLALFAYLAVEENAQPRDKLVDLFWPASDEQLGKSALRNTLARLRETLHSVNEPLLIERDQISFNRRVDYTLDLNLVTLALADLRLGAPLSSATPAMLQAATQIARGPFLDGLSVPDAPDFDDWLSTQRLAWRRRIDQVYDRLTLQQLDARQLPIAIETVARWISHDRLNEAAYRRLMRLHFLNGDQAAALQTYDICRTLLDRELGVVPAPRTEELLAHIRSASAPIQVSTSATDTRVPLRIPFVGRSAEFQILVQAFHSAQNVQAQVAVISGESGIGKTRLSDEFLKWASTEGADVLRGRAFETSGRRLPYQPVADSLRAWLEIENAPDDLLDDVWLVELSRILPELRERYPDLAAPAGDDSTARARLFEAIARLGEALSARRPLIWLMDDLQWADTETLELLHYLARNWRTSRAPIMILILMRGEALGYGSTLRSWMSELTKDMSVTRLNLSAMSADDLRQLIFSMAGENAIGSSELSAWLTSETAGQPFFLAETLIALDGQEALVWIGAATDRILDAPATLRKLKALGPQSIAPAIRDVVLSRLEWLSQPASAVLAAAAVLGRNCRFERLCQVSGLDEQGGLNALDELLAARLILEARDEARPYIISHDRIREIVYAQLSEARQQVFHRRALTALTAAKAPSAELAYHALIAKDWQSAFDQSLLAGDEAMRLYAVAGAIDHYQTARRLLNEQHVNVGSVICQRLYMDLGKAFEIEFHQLDALAIYQEMQALAVKRGDRAMELAALVASGNVRAMPYDAHDVVQAAVLAEHALPLARALGDLKAEAQIEHSLALLHIHGDRRTEPAIAHIERSAQLARLAKDSEALGLALLILGTLRLTLGHIEQAEAAWREAVDLFRREDNRPRLQDAVHLLAMLCLGTGQFDRTLAFLDEAGAASEMLGNSTETFAIVTTRNVIHLIRGDYTQALEGLSPLHDMDEKRIIPWILIAVRQQLAWLYYELGAYDAAFDQCRLALSCTDEGRPSVHVPELTVLALIHIARSEWSQATRAVAHGLEIFDRAGMLYPEWWENLPFLLAQGELALAQGDVDQAAACAEYLMENFQKLRLRHLLPGVFFLRARIALAQGNKVAAKKDLQSAHSLSIEIGSRRDLWGICWALAQLEAEQGDVQTAERLKNEACAAIDFVAEHIGAPELRVAFLARADVDSIRQ